MKTTLRNKIVFITITILFVTIGAGTFVSGYIFSDVYSRNIKSMASIIGTSLVFKLERLLAMGFSLDELVGFEEQCIEILDKHDNISYAMVLNTTGTILFHNDPLQHGRIQTSQERLEAIQDRRENWRVHSEDGNRYYESLLPVLDLDGRHAGEVIVGFPTTVVSEQTRRLVLYSVGVAVASFALGSFLLVFALSSWVSKPLEQLLGAIYDVKNKTDGFSTRVAIDSGDEIGAIAFAFNQMTENLRKTTVSKQYMDSIIDGMMDTLLVVDPDGTIRTVNKALCDLLGYTADELVGQSVGNVLITDTTIRDGMDLCKRVESGVLMEKVVYYKTRDNTLVPVLFGGSAMKDRGGALVSMICTGRDITDRIRAEKALRESEDRYRDLVEFSDFIICTHNLDGRILSINKGAAECLKYDLETLMTMNVRDVLLPDAVELFDEYIATLKREGAAKGLMRVQTSNGEKRVWEYTNTLRTEGVAFPVVRAMANDITQKMAAEKERERFIKELQEALNKVKTLSGLLPICSFCHKIRDDQGYWKQLEAYIRDHSDAEFSHGICRECAGKHYPDLNLYDE